MRKLIVIAALAFAVTVPAITSYASWDWTKGAQDRTTRPYTPATYGAGGKDSPWDTLTSMFKDYPGRPEGIWKKTEDYFYYYVLPDGSNLKNAYVDGMYIPWTGLAVPLGSANTNINYVMQNAFYGGQMPYNECLDASYANFGTFKNLMPDGFSTGALEKYHSGSYPELNYLKEAYDWMDAQMPSLMQLSEIERAKQMAVLLAEKLDYTVTDDCGAVCFHTGQAGENGFSSLYDAFAIRAGIRYHAMYGNKPYSPRPNDRWNSISTDGGNNYDVAYYVDITLYKETGDAKFLFADQDHQWRGCATVEELMAQAVAEMQHSDEKWHNGLKGEELETRLAELRSFYEEMYN